VEENILKKTVRSGAWMTGLIFFNRALDLVTFLILSRFMLPESYGVMVSAAIVTDFLNTISQTGFEGALIQKKENIKEYLNQVWTLNIIKSIVVFLVIYIIAPYVAEFLQIGDYENIIRFTGLYVVMMGMANIGGIYFFKDINYKLVFYRDAGSPVIYLITALICIQFSTSVWVLAIAQLSTYAWPTIMTYVISKYRPVLDFRWGKLKDLTGYSKWLVGGNIVNYINSIIDSVFMAHVLGAANLGLYSKAKNLASIPSGYLGQITRKIGFPSVAKIQNDENTVLSALEKTYEISLFITLPFMALLLTQSGNIINFLLTKEWIGVAEPLKLIAVAFVIKSLNDATYPFLYGLGKPKTHVMATLAQAAVLFVGLSLLVPVFGIIGAVYAFIIAISVSTIFTTRKLIVLTKFKIIKIIPSLLVIIVPSIMVIIFGHMYNVFIDSKNIFIYGLALIGLGLVYILPILILGHKFGLGPVPILKMTFHNLIPQKISKKDENNIINNEIKS
jgi:O-antigen/teichoic acid export membrane protein